jgi:CheY-like chemotaxis protein
MGGDLIVRSIKGVGSTFSLLLPFLKPNLVEVNQLEENLRKVRALENDQASASSNNKPFETLKRLRRIFAVEVSLINLRLLKRTFQDKPCIITIANNGAEAIAAFKNAMMANTFFDIILMDVEMPLMNGIIATQEIRNFEKVSSLCRTPIITLSANALDEDKKSNRRWCKFCDYKTLQYGTINCKSISFFHYDVI